MTNRNIKSFLLLTLLLVLIAGGVKFYQRSEKPSNIEPSANDSVTELPINLVKEDKSSDEFVDETPVIDDIPAVVEPIETKRVFDHYQTIVDISLSNENVNSMIQDVYNITASNGSRVNNGVVALTDLDITVADLDLAETVDTVTYTTVETEDGSRVTYIESNNSAPQMYTENQVDNLEVLIISNSDGIYTVIEKDDVEFDKHMGELMKVKDEIRLDKLTNLERLLEGTQLVYDGSSYFKSNGTKNSDFEVYSGQMIKIILSKDAEYHYINIFVDTDFDDVPNHKFQPNEDGLKFVQFDMNEAQKDFAAAIFNRSSYSSKYKLKYNE